MRKDFRHIAIIGIGLIGSSFALALRKQGYKGNITGIGRKRSNLRKGQKLGIIDNWSTDYAAGIRDADLIMLAVPVGHFEPIIRKIRGTIKKGAIVTDVGSVKGDLVRRIGALMPAGVSFVGAHPIAGRECSGIDCASADLFKGARCIITPDAGTSPAALGKIRQIWKFIGARTVIMDPQEHDRIFGAVSHLPHVVAYALVNSITRTGMNSLSHGGSGLRDMTRIALSPPELWKDICTFNRKNVLRELKKFSLAVTRITGLIERSDWNALEKEFLRARQERQTLE